MLIWIIYSSKYIQENRKPVPNELEMVGSDRICSLWYCLCVHCCGVVRDLYNISIAFTAIYKASNSPE